MLPQFLLIFGICVEAISGAIAAGRKNMDFFGVILIACVAALGGGTLRDVLFDTYPVSWVNHPEYLVYTSVCAFSTIFIARYFSRIMTLFLIFDAIGLASFVIGGVQKSLADGLTPSIAVLSGMISGICGGMLRDILCNDIPLVLRKELYAIIALGGALLFITLNHFHVADILNVAITLLAIFTARILAITFHIEIPKFNHPTHREGS